LINRPISTPIAAWQPRRRLTFDVCGPKWKPISKRCAQDRRNSKTCWLLRPRYLLGLLAQSSDAADLRRRKLIDRVLADFDHLLDNSTHD
jgi:hypothetical protein